MNPAPRYVFSYTNQVARLTIPGYLSISVKRIAHRTLIIVQQLKIKPHLWRGKRK